MKKRVNKKAFIAFVLLLFFFSQPAFAVTKTSVANGNWSAAATWSPSGVPGASDNVIINTNVVLDVDIEVVGPFTLTINAGKSLIGNSTSRRLGYDLTSGSPIVFTNNGTFTIGILNRTASGSTNNTDWIFNNYGTFTIQNTGACNGTSSPFAFGYGIFTNFAGGVVNSSGCFYLGGGSSLGVLHNYGSMTLDEYNVHSSATWRNHPGGIITITGLLTAGGLNQDNDGCINALGGIRVFEKGGNNNLGTFTMHDNAKLFVAAGTSFNVNSNTILTGVDDDGNNANNGCISSSVQITNSGTITGEFYLNDPDGLVSGTVGSQVVLGTGNCGGVCAVSCTTPTAITFTQVAPTCTGATANNNGTISLATATNGTHFGISTLNAASYDGPTTVAGATALGALPMVIKSSVPNTGGTYRVRIFNGADACFTDMTVTVNAVTCVCTPPPASITGTNTICNGSSTTLTASGGGTYLWSTGEVTAAITVSPSSTTTYTVTVTLSGCTATANRTVTVTQPPSAISFTQVPATCTGATANNNGTISLASATNATHFGISTLNAASYDGPTTIATATALGALPMVIKSSVPNTGGTYRVRVFNTADGCYTDQTVTVNPVACCAVPTGLTFTQTAATCTGGTSNNNGTISLSAATNGTHFGISTLNAASYDGPTTIATATALGALPMVIKSSVPNTGGTYRVRVFNTADGCYTDQTVTVNPVACCAVPTGLTFTQTAATCTGGTSNNDGTISLSAATNGTHFGISTLNAASYDGPTTIATATALGALPMVIKSSVPNTGGTYRVRVFNTADGCYTDQTVTVNPVACCAVPTGLTFTQTAATCTGGTSNNNGTISLSAATNGTHFGISTLNAASYDGPTTIATATALGALPMVIKSSVPNTGGTYRVRVFNTADGCYTDQTVTVNPVACCAVPTGLTFTQTAATCTGGTSNNNGTISLSAATNGTHFGISTLNAASYDGPTTIATATALGALPMVIKSSVPNTGGTYRVRVFNTADGCYTDQTVTVTAVTCSNSFEAVNGVQITVCSGINMNLSSTPIGGTAPYTYLWSGPSGFTANIQYPVVPYVTTANSGSYTVTVTESTGMTATATTNVTILPPGDPACFTVCTNPTGISFGQQTATCTGLVANNNGTISITGATNATHVGISSLNAAVYDGPTTIATSIPLTAFPMLIKSSIPNTGGTYLVRLYNLYDACYTERIVTVAAVNCFSAIASSTVSVCYGSILNLVSSPNGGVAPYTYVWSGPSAFTSNQQNPTINPVTNVNAGTYYVTVTEGTGMTAVATTTVNVLAVGSPGCGTLGPAAVNDAKTIPEGGTAFGSVGTNDSDPDNTLAQLTFTFGSPTSGTLVGQPNGTYLFTPSSPDFNGIVIIPYTVCDPTSLCDDAILTITVTPVNDPPIAVNDNATVISGNSVVVPVLNNDSNGPDGAIVPSSVTVTVPALHGTTTVNTTTGAITYTPNTGYVGTDVLTYQVCDDGSPAPGACVTALVNITVVSDKDNDGIPDNTDIDDDNDGILDSNENPAGYADGGGDLDSDGTPNYKDTQNPNCGGLNTAGACTSYDKDGDGVPDQFDLDSDNDGVTDVVEAGASDPDNNGIIGIGAVPADQDQDGLADVVDASPLTGALGSIGTPNTDTDGDGKPNAEDLDSDNDGITDILEAGGSDADNNGIVGTGATPTDTDGDGLADIADQAPATFGDTGNTTPNEDSDNDGKPDSRDLDSDNDGITDVIESGGSDTDNNGIVGTTVNPLDTDNDGLADVADQSPTFGDAGNTTPYADLDNDGTPNAEDIDSDNDGLTDIVESGLPDTDNNGIVGVGQNPTDTDGDGLADVADQSGSYGDAGNTNVPVNTDASGAPDYLDIDADNDGIVDVIEWQTTAGYTVPAGADIDGDGLDNAYDQFTGFGDAGNINTPTNSDGADTPDYIDTNSDNDAQTDAIEGWDTNGDNVANTLPANADADNDGLDDAYDVNDAATNPTNGTTPTSYPDLDAPGTPERDWRELVPEICGNGVDDDGDGSIDENCPNFTPTIEMDNVTFLTGFVSRDFVINISEINNAPSSGQIVLKVPKISAFTYAFSPTTTLSNVYGGSVVDNSLWDMTQNALFVTLTLKPGVVLPAYSIYSIGMTVTRKANIPTQTNQPVTVTIVDKSGADNNDFDNTYNVVIKAQ